MLSIDTSATPVKVEREGALAAGDDCGGLIGDGGAAQTGITDLI